MATSDSESDAHPSRVNGSDAAEEHPTGTLEPCTPSEIGAQPMSQITLPSTEIPASPMDPNLSFRTELNDDRAPITVIPSSLTPPPSTQVAANASDDANSALPFTNSQRSVLFSPPATILNTMRDREIASDYVPPAPRQVLEAPPDELRAMLQTCIAEHQKLKMEAAHHKLQFNLLSLQADEESKRAAVEHDMVRRQVDALRMAEHSRQAKRELSGTSESLQSKYLQLKVWYEQAMEDNENLNRRVKVAKKVIQQKEEEKISLVEEREMLLNRIRENREHFHMLCSPGGIFHGALTPKQTNLSPQQQRTTPRTLRRDESDGRGEHGLSALLEAMNQSQDHGSNSNANMNNNNSAPTTPMVLPRPAPRLMGRHHRNAQSMSSLPTTPMNRPNRERGGLLPSVNLVAQTEPRLRQSQRRFVPSTPPVRRPTRRKSRDSTISAEDNEELARQAVESVRVVQSLAAQRSASARSKQGHGHANDSRQDEDKDGLHEVEDGDGQVYGSQASQAATEMLRRHAKRSIEMANVGAGDESQGPAEMSAAMQAKLFPNSSSSSNNSSSMMSKRKFDGDSTAGGGGELGQGQSSPNKKARRSGGGSISESPKVGLGIQYRR